MSMSGSDEEKRKRKAWGTWEDLVLACAVKRHGLKNWESVSTELQAKTSLPRPLLTSQCCKQKYYDLNRRFEDDPVSDNNNNPIPWLEHLRKLRVDELKQEVQRYDLSILSLQLKVKKLEEEPDLENEKNGKTGEPHNKSSSEGGVKEIRRSLLLPGEGEGEGEEESDRENRSVNESNSTGLSAKNGRELLVKTEPDPVRSGGSVELGDSATQLSSDVQSSASFGSKRQNNASGGDTVAMVTGTGDAKSEPLIRLLSLIRTHNHVSLFERRLKSQECEEYKELVRQHVDLETLQTRVERGSYSACIFTFYRDLLLLFNNAIVYFPKASLESETAHQLLHLVSNEIKKETHKSDSSQPAPPFPSSAQPEHLLERSDSLLVKHKASTPIFVCRKRSSATAQKHLTITDDNKKPPATELKPPPMERNLLKVKAEEEKKPVTTGARSSRRSSRTNLTSNSPAPPSSGISGSVDKQETPKTEKNSNSNSDNNNNSNNKDKNTKKKKKNETSDKKKRVVDFLKRIEKNSPVQTVVKRGSKGGAEQKKSIINRCKKKEKGILLRSADKKQAAAAEEEISPSKRSVGRPPKKAQRQEEAATASTVSGKRGRDIGGKEAKRQRKRARK